MLLRKKFDLRGCRFIVTDLEKSVFTLCNLSRDSFNNGKLSGVVFEKSDLSYADFSGADIEGVNFDDCIIDKTVLDMRGFVSFGKSKGFVMES